MPAWARARRKAFWTALIDKCVEALARRESSWEESKRQSLPGAGKILVPEFDKGAELLDRREVNVFHGSQGWPAWESWALLERATCPWPMKSNRTRSARQAAAPAAGFNHALQRTAAGRRGCNRRASWPPSLSLSRRPLHTP